MPEEQLLREELNRVLASASFARSERLSKLLRFLVERHLEGRDGDLKESVIGVEFFGRSPDYDPKLDSTVRTEAVRLRARLHNYYSTEGARNALVIELPKGGYVIRCRPGAIAAPEVATARPRWRLFAGAAVLLIAVAATGWTWSSTRPIPVGVFPLVSLSDPAQSDDFADGLTNEIIRQASGIPGLTVRSRTSSFALKGKAQTARDAARELDAEYIVEGSVARTGADVRITIRLVRGGDDVPLWTGTFDRRVRSALATQHEISRALVNALQLKLERGSRGYDTDAYDFYLRAVAARDVRFPGDDEVIGLFEQAIGRDPSMAPAFAGLATAYAFQSFQMPGDPRRATKLDKMQAAAARAIQLDPSLGESHSAAGAAHARSGRWDLAEQSFRRAIEIDPGLSAARRDFALFVLWPLGRLGEAVREIRVALANDSLSPRARRELAEVLLAAGEYDQAARECEQLPPEMVAANECLGRARVAQGRTTEAIPLLTSAPSNNWGYAAYAYAKAGRRDETSRLAATARTRYPNRTGPFQYALAFAGLEDKDQTLEHLRQMADVGPVRMGFTLRSPEFAFLRDDPRAAALRKQVGLPE